jgi:peptidoglycan/LPS O-acetylase OafA/YrhL
MHSRPGSMPHMPALDGLRGLAVAGVVWFHLGGRLGAHMVGGYLGVDLFFVLSGYLITSVLLAEYAQTQAISLRAFWIRRARRLLPALLLLMPAIALYAWLLAKPDEVLALRKDALATLAYVANWRAIWSDKSYWALFAAPSPLEHTWSLAIEEQFYIAWPLLFVLAVVRLKLSRHALALLALALAGLSIAAMALLFDPEKTARAYFGTDTRAASILLGAALSFALRDRSLARFTRLLDVLGVLCIVLLALAWTRLEGQNPLLYRGGFVATELACLVLIVCSTLGHQSLVARALSLKPIAWLGTISYGIYLWHWPVFCLLTLERVHVSEGALAALRLAMTLALALASFHGIENTIRRHGLAPMFVRLPLPSGIKRPVFAVIGVFVLCVALVLLGTMPKRALTHMSVAVLHKSSAPIVAPGRYAVPNSDLPAASVLPPKTLRILTVGDSVAKAMAVSMRHVQDTRVADRVPVFVADRGVGSCSIMESLEIKRGVPLGHPNPKVGCAADWVRDVANLKPDITFIVIGGAFFTTFIVDGKRETACGRGWQEGFRARYEQLLEEMGSNAGRVVVALAPYPGQRWIHGTVLADVDCLNALLREIASAHGLQIVDIAKHLCPTRECALLSEDGVAIRPDGLHPEYPGATELALWTLSELADSSRR